MARQDARPGVLPKMRSLVDNVLHPFHRVLNKYAGEALQKTPNDILQPLLDATLQVPLVHAYVLAIFAKNLHAEEAPRIFATYCSKNGMEASWRQERWSGPSPRSLLESLTQMTLKYFPQRG